MTRLFMALWLALAGVAPLSLVTAISAYAVQPDEVLDDPDLEARARELSRGLRCMVCRNESIDESNAELARDLAVSPQAMNMVLRGLQNRGLVSRPTSVSSGRALPAHEAFIARHCAAPEV